MSSMTFQQMIDLINLLPEQYRTITYYGSILVGFNTLSLKTIDYTLICTIDKDHVKWVKSYSWKTPQFNETLYDSREGS